MKKLRIPGIGCLLFWMIISACAPPPPQVTIQPQPVAPPPTVITVNHQTYASEIIAWPGPAVVVFYNADFWQSLDMERRIEWLAKTYPGKAKFAKFHWQVNDDPSRFNLEMLPTVILYQSGNEIDRIKGIPPEEKDRLKWNEDLELWFLKNALGLKGSEYSADYTYLFKNGYKLNISNY
ncbi:MAG: thioredoxin domain-containing protein [Pseudomonadota bacterium]